MRCYKLLIFSGIMAWLYPAWCNIASAQPWNLEVLSYSIISGSYAQVAYQNDVAYIASGYGVRILDIADPANPVEITNIPTDGLSKSVTVIGDNMFVCDFGNGLLSYDISDAYNPVYLDKLELTGGLRAAIPYGDYLYVTAEENGVRIVDWSQPANLQLVTTLYTGGETFQAAIYDDWLYVSMGQAGMGVYDLTDPEDPQLQLIWNTDLGKSMGLCVFPSQDVLTLADFTNGVYILDLTYPWIPTWIATVAEPTFSATHVASLGSVGACAYQAEGVETFNLNGAVLDYLDLGMVTLGVYSVEDKLYVAAGDSGMLIVDAANPANLVLENSIHGYDQVANVCLNGNIAYLANGRDGLRTMDILDRENPISIENDPTQFWALDVLLHPMEPYAYVTDFDVGIQTYSIADPLHPAWVHTSAVDPDTAAHTMVYRNGYLYVTNYMKGLNIFDLDNPAAPVLVYTAPDSVFRFREIAFTEDGDYLFACCEESGLRVYDVIEPDSVVYDHTIPGFYKPFDILVKGDYAYLADFDNGLFVLNVSNPAYIFKVDSLPAQSAFSSVRLIDDNHLAVCDWDKGVAIVDITDPEDISEIDRSDTPGIAARARSDGQYLYVADNYDFLIFDLNGAGVKPGSAGGQMPERISLHPAYPNPFNAATSITFSLAAPADVQLAVYDVGGGKVADLLHSPCSAGMHRVNFKADGLASGLYFVRLEADGAKPTQKIMLVK